MVSSIVFLLNLIGHRTVCISAQTSWSGFRNKQPLDKVFQVGWDDSGGASTVVVGQRNCTSKIILELVFKFDENSSQFQD